MGAFMSRQFNDNNLNLHETNSNNFKFPPQSKGSYFAKHFIMGGERFDNSHPENFLFGENNDLNFLNSPSAFPYPPPQASEPTKTLKSMVNIRKESVKFVKSAASKISTDPLSNKGNTVNIEFIFDSDTRCAITIYHFCTEEISPSGVKYLPKNPTSTSETFHYQKGANQTFSQPYHCFNPSQFSDDELLYHPEKDVFPIAIHCVVDEGSEECRQSHSTICVVDHHATDGCYVLRAMKQKIFVDGLCYLLQEIYGIENKNLNRPISDEENEDNGSECVICMCDSRDTLILPCRHLCLCNACADSLRYQASNCPICRAPFRALLQIKAVQKASTAIINMASSPSTQELNSCVPIGYIPVSLIEALNGPGYKSSSLTGADKLDGNTLEVNKKDTENNLKNSPANSLKRSSKEKLNQGSVPGEQYRMSVLLSKEESSDLLVKRSPSATRTLSHKKEKTSVSRSSSNRECVKYINEKNSNNDLDDDSEAEKLSPLLITDNGTEITPQVALHSNGVEDSIDDTDTDDIDEAELKPSQMVDDIEKADDSDYFTPEDPHTTILSPLCEKNGSTSYLTKSSEILNDIVTPLTALKEAEIPDSPISGNSQVSRSSGDSYSSSSSTRQLLAPVPQANDVQKQVSESSTDNGKFNQAVVNSPTS